MIPIEEIEYKYIHKYFERFLPKAQALIPVNPTKIPGHVGGSILSQDLAMSTDMVTKPLQNLKVVYNYVRDGHNVTHTVKRLGEVAYDTGKINLMAESAPIVGPAVSGQMANSCAEKYTKKIVSDYKLVDSIKKKCIERNWAKRFGSKFVSGKTAHRPRRVVGNLLKDSIKRWIALLLTHQMQQTLPRAILLEGYIRKNFTDLEEVILVDLHRVRPLLMFGLLRQ